MNFVGREGFELREAANGISKLLMREGTHVPSDPPYHPYLPPRIADATDGIVALRSDFKYAIEGKHGFLYLLDTIRETVRSTFLAHASAPAQCPTSGETTARLHSQAPRLVAASRRRVPHRQTCRFA